MKNPRTAVGRLAAALKIPVNDFWDLSGSSSVDHKRLHEYVELLQGFQQLQDHEARRRCLRFVQDKVERSIKLKTKGAS